MAVMNVSHDGITLKFLNSVNDKQPSTILDSMTIYASVYRNSSSSSSGNPVTVPLVPGSSSDNPSITINKLNSSSGNTVNVGGQIIPINSPIVQKQNTSNKDNVEGWQAIVCVSQLSDAHFIDTVGPDLMIQPDTIKIIPVNGSIS